MRHYVKPLTAFLSEVADMLTPVKPSSLLTELYVRSQPALLYR